MLGRHPDLDCLAFLDAHGPLFVPRIRGELGMKTRIVTFDRNVAAFAGPAAGTLRPAGDLRAARRAAPRYRRIAPPERSASSEANSA